MGFRDYEVNAILEKAIAIEWWMGVEVKVLYVDYFLEKFQRDEQSFAAAKQKEPLGFGLVFNIVQTDGFTVKLSFRASLHSHRPSK